MTIYPYTPPNHDADSFHHGYHAYTQGRICSVPHFLKPDPFKRYSWVAGWVNAWLDAGDV